MVKTRISEDVAVAAGTPDVPVPPRPAPLGRPRSERARRAVLRAVDDMLVEQGYGAMTMKGIASRAGVGRETVYRWWSTKAEILLEASAADAAHELTTPASPDPGVELTTYLEALAAFLVSSDAGLAYRALVGEAQHDKTVRALLHTTDILGSSARPVLERIRGLGALSAEVSVEQASAELIGPVFYRILVQGSELSVVDVAAHARTLLRAWA